MKRLKPSSLSFNCHDYNFLDADYALCRVSQHVGGFEPFDYFVFSIFFPKEYQKFLHDGKRIFIAKMYNGIYFSLLKEGRNTFFMIEYLYSNESAYPPVIERKYMKFLIGEMDYDNWNYFFVEFPRNLVFLSYINDFGARVWHNFGLLTLSEYNVNNFVSGVIDYKTFTINSRKYMTPFSDSSIVYYPSSFYLSDVVLFNSERLDEDYVLTLWNQGNNVSKRVFQNYVFRLLFCDPLDDFVFPTITQFEKVCRYAGSFIFYTRHTAETPRIVLPKFVSGASKLSRFVNKKYRSNMFVSKGAGSVPEQCSWIKNTVRKDFPFPFDSFLDSENEYLSSSYSVREPYYEKKGDYNGTASYTGTENIEFRIFVDNSNVSFCGNYIFSFYIESTNFSSPNVENKSYNMIGSYGGVSSGNNLYFSVGENTVLAGPLTNESIDINECVGNVAADGQELVFIIELPNFTSNSSLKEVNYKASILLNHFAL